MSFDRWLDTFLSEKGIDSEETLEAEGPSGMNWIPVGCLVEMIKGAPERERKAIRLTMVKLDIVNGNVRHYLAHLAKAVAQ